jgi:hypothetical protein
MTWKKSYSHQIYIKIIDIPSIVVYYIILIPYCIMFSVLMSIDYYNDIILTWLQNNITMIIQ